MDENLKIDQVKNDPTILRLKKDSNIDNLTKEELISRVLSLEKHVQQLRNVIAKNSASNLPDAIQQNKRDKKFEFNKYKRRHVLLKICYFGWDYMGFAVQDDAGKTIESEVFAALIRSKLIESRESSNYHRCGRTDRGVSSFGQVISIDLRTNLSEGVGIFTPESYCGNNKNVKDEEVNYCNILNRNLPENIKVTAWAPVQNLNFSARFDCNGRSYKYFFPRANLDIKRMQEGATLLIGEHDFRNFCKMDVGNGVVEYKRRIDQLIVQCVHREHPDEESAYDMCEVNFVGKAYLWHQIRCIMAVLFLIGEGKEKPEVITELLDVSRNPCRPAYSMADHLPLNLFHCNFDNIDWQYDQTAMAYVLKTLQKVWTEHSVKTEMIRSCLKDLESHSQEKITSQVEYLAQGRKDKVYTPLMNMQKCPSLEDKIMTVVKRRKIDLDS